MGRRTRTLLILALLVVSFFTITSAIRGFQHARRLRAGPDEPIKAWMNIPYISHSYRVPPQLIHDAIGLPHGQRDRRPLRELARDQGRTTEALIIDITRAISESRALEPPQPPEPPLPPEPPATPAPPPTPPEVVPAP